MADDEQIEKCAQLCDAMVQELTSRKTTARKAHYDRQTPLQIDYAIRAVRRLAERLRALKGVTHEPHAAPANGDRLAKAAAIAKELLPVIAKVKDSAWKQDILKRLQELVG